MAAMFGPTLRRFVAANGEGCYHASQDENDRRVVLDRFRNGESTLIFATSSLGAGLDVPGVTCIIHLGSPHSMTDYLQESGRAGREDGAHARSTIFFPLSDALYRHTETDISPSSTSSCTTLPGTSIILKTGTLPPTQMVAYRDAFHLTARTNHIVVAELAVSSEFLILHVVLARKRLAEEIESDHR